MPYGLTQDQYENQNLRLALRAKEDMIWTRGPALAHHPKPPSDGVLADGDEVAQWVDAGPDRAYVEGKAGNLGDNVWKTASAASDATKAWSRDGTGVCEIRESKAAFRYLHEDTHDWTIIMRVAINHALSNGSLDLLTNRSFPGGTKGFNFTYGAGNGELSFFVHSGGSGSHVSIVTWPSFAQDTLYTIAARHTQGAETELYIDDLGTALASDTITTWSSGVSTENLNFGKQRPPNCEYVGAVICRQKLTQGEMEAFETWMTEPQ